MVVATQRPPVPAITTRDVDRLTSSVDGLQTIVRELKEIIVGRPDLDRQYPISSTYAYVLDYRDRFFVYLFAPVALTLSIEDYGTLTVLANNWTLLPFQLGTRIFATNITGAGVQQNMLIRCTDRYISSYSSTSGLPASVNIAQFGGVPTQMYTADGVAYANVPEVGIGLNSGSAVNRLLAVSAQSFTGNNASASLAQVPFSFNGTTFDALRANFDTVTVQTLTAQGAGTANSAIQTNFNGRGIMLCVNISSVTGSLTVNVQATDGVSGTFTTLLASTAIAATGQTFLFVYPGIAASANVAASATVPRSWRVSSVVVTGPVSAVISASVIL